jgi:hypothetical protein
MTWVNRRKLLRSIRPTRTRHGLISIRYWSIRKWVPHSQDLAEMSCMPVVSRLPRRARRGKAIRGVRFPARHQVVAHTRRGLRYRAQDRPAAHADRLRRHPKTRTHGTTRGKSSSYLSACLSVISSANGRTLGWQPREHAAGKAAGEKNLARSSAPRPSICTVRRRTQVTRFAKRSASRGQRFTSTSRRLATHDDGLGHSKRLSGS